MFEVGVWELFMIGAVALVVLGPERLPGVARTAGHMLGRFQRYVNQVKSDIQREVQLEELRKLQGQMQQAAHDVEQSVMSFTSDVQKEANSIANEFSSVASDGVSSSTAEWSAAEAYSVPALDNAAGHRGRKAGSRPLKPRRPRPDKALLYQLRQFRQARISDSRARQRSKSA